jgi:hypothetical protein
MGDVYITKDGVVIAKYPHRIKGTQPMPADVRLMEEAPRMLGDLKAIRDGWLNVEAHVRPLTPWEKECLLFITETINDVEVAG